MFQRAATLRVPVPPWGLALTAILSIQLGSALSLSLIATVGPAGTAWLRLSMGAVILLAIARPPLRSIRRRDILPLLALGISTGLISVAYLAALERIPLGTAVAIGFLGPLTVAAVRSPSRRDLIWPTAALVGVVLLTQPWQGDLDLLGVIFAGSTAFGWAAYIVLTQRIGDHFTGIGALSLTVPIAALAAAVMGVPQAASHITPEVLAIGAGLAVLVPVLPFALEMLALRRMTATAFGTLLALEPAIGALLGLLILHQQPSTVQILGIAIVVLAGVAAQRSGRRPSGPGNHQVPPTLP